MSDDTFVMPPVPPPVTVTLDESITPPTVGQVWATQIVRTVNGQTITISPPQTQAEREAVANWTP